MDIIAYDSHVFQPWQVRELVAFLETLLDCDQAWCLGHRLLHSGVVSVADGRLSCIDFDDADGLWRELCKSSVSFNGIWAEIMYRTLAHARATDESISFFYEMCYVCARDGSPVLRNVEPLFVSRMRVKADRLLGFAARGVSDRKSDRKRKAVDVQTEVQRVAPFLGIHSERSVAARTARDNPSAWA